MLRDEVSSVSQNAHNRIFYTKYRMALEQSVKSALLKT